MVRFQTKNLNFGKIFRVSDWRMFKYILRPFELFYEHLGYFMTIWHIVCSFGTFFSVLVSRTKKNLATLISRPITQTPPVAHNARAF
jgi:hypothetical protein